MGYGDEIVAAGEAQRLFDRTGLKSTIVDIERRQRWHPIWEGNPIILREGTREPAQRVHTIVNGPNARPYIVYPFTEDTGWTFNKTFHCRDHRAKIYLTDVELRFGQSLYEQVGPYVLIEPWSKHANLRWPRTHWEALIARRRDLTFVQHLHSHSGEPLDHVELAMTSTFREACALVVGSSLYIRGESGMCHAAAALRKPQVTIWGACMDWDVMGGYEGQIGVGVGEHVCGSYRPCAHCALTMHDITVEQVSRAIDAQLECYGLR